MAIRYPVTPFEVHLMMHLYYLGSEWPNKGPGYHEGIRKFLYFGLIEPHDTFQSGYHVTPRGEEYVKRLCGTHLT